MSEERPKRPPIPRPEEEFGLTERERLYDRISYARLLELLGTPGTTVHKIEESYNNYGGFLFVMLSRPGQKRRMFVTFWGLGFHEGRERWIMGEWFYYVTNERFVKASRAMSKAEAKRIIEERRATILAYPQDTQTKRGELYEMLAELTDEDGAQAEMEDLDALGWWLLGKDE